MRTADPTSAIFPAARWPEWSGWSDQATPAWSIRAISTSRRIPVGTRSLDVVDERSAP